jgi:hypothetical protein
MRNHLTVQLFMGGMCMASLLAPGAEPERKSVTLTGWFSDAACATARAKSGVFTATNPDCAKKCIEKGAAAIFIGEHVNALYTVKGYASAVDDLGYRMEVLGTVNDTAKTITIVSAKRLEYQGAACARRPTKTAY